MKIVLKIWNISRGSAPISGIFIVNIGMWKNWKQKSDIDFQLKGTLYKSKYWPLVRKLYSNQQTMSLPTLLFRYCISLTFVGILNFCLQSCFLFFYKLFFFFAFVFFSVVCCFISNLFYTISKNCNIFYLSSLFRLHKVVCFGNTKKELVKRLNGNVA